MSTGPLAPPPTSIKGILASLLGVAIVVGVPTGITLARRFVRSEIAELESRLTGRLDPSITPATPSPCANCPGCKPK